jgi:Cu/Ag efflux protein CusF
MKPIAALKATCLGAALGLAVSLGAHAQSTPAVDGEVRKLDREQGKVTLKHGPIANLDMPGMTMVFRIADRKLLDRIKEGDKVRFAADKVDGAITITAIEVAN